MALKAGVPIAVPALTINRLCGSGFQSVINGAHVREQVVLFFYLIIPSTVETFVIYLWNVYLFIADVNLLYLQEIQLGESEVVLTGGSENMSQAPYAVRNARWGSPLGVDLKVRFNLQCSCFCTFSACVGV